MLTPSPKLSYRDLPPREAGGEVARHGFEFQDHVSAYFLLKMCKQSELLEVWCETHDDITLVWARDPQPLFEFVQVKSDELGKHWSVADITARDKKDKVHVPGTSILERALDHDHGTEPCCFRMVTTCKVDDTLSILLLPLDAPSRKPGTTSVIALTTAVMAKVSGFVSGNGNDGNFWASRARWEVLFSIDHVQRINLEALSEFCEARGAYLVSDQKRSLYDRVLQKARTAATTKFEVDRHAKRLVRTEFIAWLEQMLDEIRHPAKDGGKGARLLEKLDKAGINDPTIQANAAAQRQYYARRRYNPRFLDLETQEDIESHVREEIPILLGQLERNQVAEGLAFLEHCGQQMRELSDRLKPDVQVTPGFLTGCLYETADRCQFRFGRTAI